MSMKLSELDKIIEFIENGGAPKEAVEQLRSFRLKMLVALNKLKKRIFTRIDSLPF